VRERSERLIRLREAQRLASARARSKRCNTTVRVLVEESRRLRERDPIRRHLDATRAWFGRSEGEAPGVDGGIYFTGGARAGEFANVRLDSMTHLDFLGRAVEAEQRAG
jgi:tRNA A37 methylthiotransferase MiaB